MPRRQGAKGSPKELAGTDWPAARVEENSPVWYAQEIARRLEEAIGSQSLREVGRLAELDHTTISAVVNGERWADLVTLAKLEAALGVRIWPESV
jgi:hypothetical protein